MNSSKQGKCPVMHGGNTVTEKSVTELVAKHAKSGYFTPT